MKPLVSILVPAFNSEQWIAGTLHSAVAQTWQNKEIIVVNDGSRDNTEAIARRFEPMGVRVVTQKNQGAAAARNTAFSLSKGDYIQWLDADDFLSPDKVARQVEAAEHCGDRRMLISSAWGQFLYRYYRAEFVPSALWCDLTPVEWLLRKMDDNLHMQTATWLVSRELTEAAGPWNTQLLGDDDGEYFCRVLLASHGVKFVPEAKVYYRATPNSLSYIGQSDKKAIAQWHSMELHIAYLRSLEDSPRIRAACIHYLQNWLLNFYPEKTDIVRRAEQMARELEGVLQPPRLSWKYSWIESLFGWGPAKKAQLLLPRIRWSFKRAWDKALFQLDRHSLSTDWST